VKTDGIKMVLILNIIHHNLKNKEVALIILYSLIYHFSTKMIMLPYHHICLIVILDLLIILTFMVALHKKVVYIGQSNL